MNRAFSLYSCSIVSIKNLIKIDEQNKASLLNYGKNQYVCPECYKPLFPKSINSKYSKPHFSHYEKGIYDPDCSIRKKRNNRNKLKEYLNKNKSIAKQIFQDIYIKASIIHIKKSINSYINEILNIQNENYNFYFNYKNNNFEFKSSKSEFKSKEIYSINLEQKDLIFSFKKYADLIFSLDNSRSTFQSRNLCQKIISPLLRDIKDSKDQFSDNLIEEAIDEIFVSISLTKGFGDIQYYLIYASLLLTIISYSRRSIKQENNELFSIDIKKILPNVPLNIKEALLSFFATIPDINFENQFDFKLDSILQNNKYMTSIKERLVWFLNLIKFEDILLSDLEQFECFNNETSSSGFIYTATSKDLQLIYDYKEIVKIGRSIDPVRREVQLSGQLLNNPVKISKLWKVSDQVKAESIIFEELSNFRIKKSREIFNLNSSKSELMITKILRQNDLLLN